MQINLHNAKAEANLRNMEFFDDKAEWAEYLKENPELEKLMLASPEDRFKDGKTAIDVFRESVEYMPRSLIGRPLQVYLARTLVALLNEEKKTSVLDYGCGAGNMGILFSHLGFKVDLLEVEGVHTDFLKWRVKRHFLSARVLTEDAPLATYDLVILFNVLEHLMQPKQVLERIVEALNPKGYFSILFNTHGHGLDIVSMDQWEKELKPYILEHFWIIPNTDEMLYQKKY